MTTVTISFSKIQIRSGSAVFAISGGSAVYASRSNFRDFDTANNLDHHRSAFKIIILVDIDLSNPNQKATKKY